MYLHENSLKMTALQINPVLDAFDVAPEEPISSNSRAKKQAILRFIQQEIAVLKQNWDGYGASPIEQKVLLNVRFLINKLPDLLSSSLEKDTILPNPNGTISMEWANKDNELFLEIGNDYSTYYLKNKGKIKKINNHFIITNDSEFQQFVKNLNSI